MANLSNYLENKLVDHIFRGISYAMPMALYIALYTSAPTDANQGVEVSGGSYARVALPPSTANWRSTNGTTTGPSVGTGGATSNAVTFAFPVPTAPWGTITHFGILDASVGGNLLVHGDLTTPMVVGPGDPAPTFGIDALEVEWA